MISTIIGTLATICLVCGYMPQAIMTMRTRNTDGISMTSWSFMALGGIFFIVQGAMTGNWPLVVANSITTACSVIIACIKISNDMKKR